MCSAQELSLFSAAYPILIVLSNNGHSRMVSFEKHLNTAVSLSNAPPHIAYADPCHSREVASFEESNHCNASITLTAINAYKTWL